MFHQALVISVLFINLHFTLALSAQQCKQQISQGCTNTYVPTEEEVERARIYLQEIFTKSSSISPVAEPCKKLYVRRNFKCMSHEERERVIKVAQQLYANGFMAEIAEIHAKCWPAWHTTSEGLMGHRILGLKLEQAMREIDPDITLPYWSTAEDCFKPEDSLIWRYFGTAGDKDNYYCVPDGPFTEQTKGRCIKRQWLEGKKIAPWYCPELENMFIRMKFNLGIMYFLILGYHFHQHLNVGGYNGQMSVVYAPYDFIFFLHHNFYSECFALKWQLSMDKYLTPDAYHSGKHFNLETHNYTTPNITTDKICYYNTSILDSFHVGFGEQCSVCDQVIQAINQEIKNNASVATPDYLTRYATNQLFTNFPFISNLSPITAFPHFPAEPKECNRKCRSMPSPPKYDDTEQGRRQLAEISKVGGYQFGLIMRTSDTFIRTANAMFNTFGFCSSYVSS